MKSDVQWLYWDANVFLYYLNGQPDVIPIIEALFEEVQASRGRKKIATSVLSKVEVAYLQQECETQQFQKEIEERIDTLWQDDSVIELIEFHDGIALQAREMIRQARTKGFSLKPADAIHLASARWIEAYEIHTYDDWSRFSDMVDCPICTPSATQLSLPLKTVNSIPV